MNFSFVSSSSQKAFPSDLGSLIRNNQINPQSYDMNYLLGVSTKKLKVEHNQHGILKNTSPETHLNNTVPSESVKLSSSIPYAIAKPKESRKQHEKMGFKGQNLQGYSENNIHGKRVHPELALNFSKTVEEMKRSKGFATSQAHQAPVMNNNELYEMMRLLNTPVPDVQNYHLNYGKFPFQLPHNQPNIPALNYPTASLFQNFEQQLNYYNQMAQVLQQQQQQQQRNSLAFGDSELIHKIQMLSKAQQQGKNLNEVYMKPEASHPMNATCLIEEVANQKKSLKLDQAHLEKRHKISSVTEVRLEDLSSDNKVFKFTSSKFNVTINKKSEQDNLEEKSKVSPQKVENTAAFIKKQTLSNNFQGINLSTPLVTSAHQRIPILY